MKGPPAKLAKSYANVGRVVGAYWRAYGGSDALLYSVYFHVALVACGLSYGFWTVANWWDLVISIVPNLLGFTLGGYALLVAFLGEKFRRRISGRSVQEGGTTRDSPFLVMNASFAHFILVQALALAAAVISKTAHGTAEHSLLGAVSAALHIPPSVLGTAAIVFWGASFLLFSYALTLTAAAALAVFRVGTWLDKFDNALLSRQHPAAHSFHPAGIGTKDGQLRAPSRFAPSRFARTRFAPPRFAPPRFAPPRSAPPRFAPPRSAPPRSAP